MSGFRQRFMAAWSSAWDGVTLAKISWARARVLLTRAKETASR